jgi:hypothetical protein
MAYDPNQWNAIIADINGGPEFSTAQQNLGYIEEWQKIRLTSNMILLLPNDPGKTDLQISFRTFYAINYVALDGHNLSDEARSFICVLRYFGVRCGFLASDATHRGVKIDEVFEVTDDLRQNGEAYDNPTLGAVARPTTELVDFLRRNWTVYYNIVFQVLKVRGHHYKTEYQSIYEHLAKASMISDALPNYTPSWEQIAVTGLHSFGLFALKEIHDYCHANALLPTALSIRHNAPPAGNAQFHVAAAAFDAMKGTNWYKAFKKQYKHEIREIQAHVATINANWVQYHVSAPYWYAGVSYIKLDDAAVKVLSPYILGYISTLPSEDTLHRQKALNKHKNQNVFLQEMFARTITNFARKSADATNPIDFFSTDEEISARVSAEKLEEYQVKARKNLVKGIVNAVVEKSTNDVNAIVLPLDRMVNKLLPPGITL